MGLFKASVANAHTARLQTCRAILRNTVLLIPIGFTACASSAIAGSARDGAVRRRPWVFSSMAKISESRRLYSQVPLPHVNKSPRSLREAHQGGIVCNGDPEDVVVVPM